MSDLYLLSYNNIRSFSIVPNKNLPVNPLKDYNKEVNKLFRTNRVANCNIIKPAVKNRLSYEKEYYQIVLDLFEKWGKANEVKKLKGQTIIVAIHDAGWGHRIESCMLAKLYADVLQMRVLFVDPLELIPLDDFLMFQAKLEILRAMHQGTDLESGYKKLISKIKSFKSRFLAQIGGFIIKLTLSGIGYDKNSKGFFTDIGRKLVLKSQTDKQMTKVLVQFVNSADILITEKPLVDALDKLIVKEQAKLVSTTHSDTTRAGIRFAPVFIEIPDPGYGPVDNYPGKGYIFDTQILEAFASSNILHKAPPNYIYAVPTKKIKQNLQEFYGMKEHIEVIETITDQINEKDFLKKWSSVKKNIIFSTNGNASNTDEIALAIEQFILAGKTRTKNYRLQVFLGEHSDKVLGKKLSALIKTKMPDNIEIIRTKNKPETGLLKWEYERSAHVEFRSAGETGLYSGNVGCVLFATISSAENEDRNMFWAMNKKINLPCAWREENYNYWTKMFGNKYDPIPGFSKSYENFVDYLDYIFGDEAIAKKTAFHAFQNMNPYTGLHMLLINTAQMLYPQVDPRQLQQIANLVRLKNSIRKKSLSI